MSQSTILSGRTVAQVLLTAAIVIWSAWSTDCNSLFVLLATGVPLWLDQQVFRTFCLRPRQPWRTELLMRLGSFAAGGLVVLAMAAGQIRLRETATIGMLGSLAVYWMEWLAGGLAAMLPKVGVPDQQIERVKLYAFTILIVLVAVIAGPLASFHPLHTVPIFDPNQQGVRCEEVTLHSLDGQRLHGWLFPADEPRGNMIFAHGHSANRSQVAGILPVFRAAGLNVLAFDFRGHGDSSGRTATFGVREVDDVLTARDYLAARFPNQPLILGGISMGAGITLQSLPRIPEAKAVWLEMPFASFMDLVRHRFRTLPDWASRLLIRSYSVILWLDCGIDVQEIRPIDSARNSTVPVFIAHGRNDDLIPFTHGEQVFDAFAGPKECLWVDEATHFDLLTKAGPAYAEKLRAFLDANLPRSSSR